MEKNNYTRQDYIWNKSTLCEGCGHDKITSSIVDAFFELNVNPHDVIKLSGIGCSSKTPRYFLSQSHGFNTLHGRMASVATGSKVVNSKMRHIGISGDGDSVNIGLGGFAHLIRRNLPICYIIANNGVYGLTKGQFSATNNLDFVNETENKLVEIDPCGLAIELGCNFVARGVASDSDQIATLVKAALNFNGTAVIDITSPCVSFNNKVESVQSESFVKNHGVRLQNLKFEVSEKHESENHLDDNVEIIQLSNDSKIILNKINFLDHNVRSRISAVNIIHKSREAGKYAIGLLYFNDNQNSFIDKLNLCDKSLSDLNENDLRGSKENFLKLMSLFS